MSKELIPLVLFVLAAAAVGCFAVLALKHGAVLWFAGLVAAACMGAGIVYYVTMASRSEQEDDESPAKASAGGDPATSDRHLEHLLQGLAVGYLVSQRSPDTLGLPQHIRDRVHASIARYAQEHSVDPASGRALWCWLMKEGLGGGNGAHGSPLGEDDADGYVEYFVQGLLIGYLICRMRGGTPAIPQDIQERIVSLVRERALNQDRDPASAEALWAWMRKEGIGGNGRVKGLDEQGDTAKEVKEVRYVSR